MPRYRVEMATNPAPGLEFYRGHVDCTAYPSDSDDDEPTRDDVFRAAVRELQRTAFPDRGVNCWRMIDFARTD